MALNHHLGLSLSPHTARIPRDRQHTPVCRVPEERPKSRLRRLPHHQHHEPLPPRLQLGDQHDRLLRHESQVSRGVPQHLDPLEEEVRRGAGDRDCGNGGGGEQHRGNAYVAQTELSTI